MALVTLTALVGSGSGAVSAFDGNARACADRAFGTPAGSWLGADGPADTVGSALLGAGMLTVLCVLLRHRRPGAATWVLVGLTVQFAAETALGALVGRPMPPPADGTLPAPGYSFPSGHMASATLILMVLLVVLRARTPVWWLCLGLGSTLVAAVGVSRVLADAHHASDVVGGVLLGLVVGFAVAFAVARRVDARSLDISGKEAR
ncbi:phosphatase PAP2 family protein [Streptomyces sp. BR123]|uniref:phosphatase PAP2 family protein n=1 Tax=Streptomyces sp. BR123 TaxID=2749828 RepID=UPI0015C425D4|nr:phosphatase PAP2 family protein [Streptomyces sp. BR123]NXY93115.1 phosphatase PAP2 family protein [Streptomyces sp. BR123]